MELLIQREDPNDALATPGALYVSGSFECFTLELPVRDGGAGSAILAGIYPVTIDESARFQRPMPHVLNVPGRVGIRIHCGNTTEDTDGCILLGEKKGVDVILASRVAFDAFFSKLQAALDAKEEVALQIKEAIAIIAPSQDDRERF